MRASGLLATTVLAAFGPFFHVQATLLRGLAEGSTYTCNTQELSRRLSEQVLSRPECATAYGAALGSPSFASLGTEQKAQVMNDFCATSCGADFHAVVSSWREWCGASADGSAFVAQPEVDTWLTLGCGREASMGTLCAKFYTTGAPGGGTCAFWTSCCGGDYFRVVRSALSPERIEPACPGALQAAKMSCAYSGGAKPGGHLL